jgi:phytoene synthase
VAGSPLEDERLMARNTSFYFSFLVLPAQQRRAIVAVWDFCRAVDDAVDEESSRAVAREAVLFWRGELARCYNGEMPSTVQGRRLKPYVGQFALERQDLDDVIDGVAMDLEKMQYANFDELVEYCRRVASAVGLVCVRIFGCSDAARDYAFNLGLALQLTNILRDVKSDLRQGRLYLPLEDLAACGCTVDDLSGGLATAPVKRLIEFECRRVHEFYQKAQSLLPQDERSRLVAAEIMRAVYFETLRRIERGGYDPFTIRARVPRPQQALIAFRQWWRHS